MKWFVVKLAFLIIAVFPGPGYSDASSPEPVPLSDAESAWLTQHPEVIVGFDGNFPPYSFVNDEGEIEGYAVDVLNLVSEYTGIKFTAHHQHNWSPLLEDAKQQKVDLIATLVEREPRKAWFNFTTPYVHKSLVIVTRSEDSQIRRRDDIAGRSMALVKDYQYSDLVLSQYPSVKPHYVDNTLDALHAVAVGDVDATITFLGASHYLRNKYLISGLEYAAVFDKELSHESMGVRKDWPELVAIINKTLSAVPEHEMQKLRARWLPVDFMESLVEIKLTDAEKTWLKQHPTIRVGVDPEFAPFEFLDNGTYQGMASDYIRILAQRLNLNFEVVQGIPWSDMMDQVKRGQIDLLPAVGKTRERQDLLRYSDPYLNFHRVIVTRLDAPFISGLSDIDGQTIAVQANSSHQGFLEEKSDLGTTPYPTLQRALMAVSSGEADAFVGNVASTTYWIRTLNLTNLKVAAPASSDVQSLHFAVHQNLPELQSIINKGLATVTPRHQRNISEKWLTIRDESRLNFELIRFWGSILVGLLLLVGAWNFMLKQKVKKSLSELEYIANFDPLTGLPNRFLALDRLSQAVKEAARLESSLALMAINLNNFKAVNSAHDHETGDKLLQEVGGRLLQLQQNDNIVGHLGGDHFIFVDVNFTDISDTAILAEQILRQINQLVQVDGKQIALSACIGISVYPGDGENATTLLKHADSAAHFSKEKIRGGFSFYTDSFIQNVSRNLKIDERLRKALSNNELQVLYQAKIDARSQRLMGFEALLRWEDPELGPVSPAEFIPIAEKTSIISDIGFFVLETALTTLQTLQRRYDDSLTIAINLSPAQFRQTDFVAEVQRLIARSGVDFAAVEFEITEGVLLSEVPNIHQQLRQLESLGVSLALDDFGTGYSSMNYLRKFKFDTLKIDREFVADLTVSGNSYKLVSAIIAMAHGLDIRVVAEGVEDHEQKDALIGLDCDILQGWLFSKPVPACRLNTLLEEQTDIA